MDGTFSSLFGSDNPFKFFFLSGIVLLVIGLYYPFEKRQDLDLKKIEVEFSDSTLVVEIINLNKEIDLLSEEADRLFVVLDSLETERNKSSNPISISEKIKQIRVEFQNNFNEVEDLKYQLNLKIVTSKFKNKEIEIYESHLTEIRLYSWGFILVGISLLGYGGFRWLSFFNEKHN